MTKSFSLLFLNLSLLTFPIKFNFSLRNFEERIAETRILKAPSGVTNAAGAKAYAKRLAASPIPTVKKNRNNIHKMS